MKFLSRFLADDLKKTGSVVFRWGWWFPRQLSMREFRIGALEYEMTGSDGTPKIFLHIPSDADLSEGSVSDSLRRSALFFAEYFPRYAAAERMCESWMLSPVLQRLLPADSRILAFQRRFRTLKTDEASKAALEWIYPDPSLPYDELPETTSLRRNAKKLLLAGGTIGWTLGVLR